MEGAKLSYTAFGNYIAVLTSNFVIFIVGNDTFYKLNNTIS